MAEKSLLSPDTPLTPDAGHPYTNQKFSEIEDVKVTSTQASNNSANDSHEKKRENWGSGFDFLLSIIGFAVDLANVWKFPYFCYRNGGGAFLIPYFICLVFGAVPLFYMELLIGQFHKQGAISIWRIVPVFKGIGWTIVTVSYVVSFYYNTIIAWSIYYFFASFTSELPWTSCDNEWNTCRCWNGTAFNSTNTTVQCDGENVTIGIDHLVSPTSEFFERRVLNVHRSDGLGNLGGLRWDLTLCLMLAFTVIYFATWKGVKTSGKVVYLTAIMPYVILSILFIRGLFLDGAVKGLYYFANPDLYRLTDPQVWIEAAMQVFYSVGPGFGVHLTMASYNKFNNNCYRDCLITAAVNSFTSLFSGCVVFIYLGYMSVTMGRSISTVASQGPSLIFEVYPQAISTLAGSTAWSLLFFFMVIMLGMDSAMGGLESVATGVIDEFGSVLKKYKWHREIFMAVIISISFLCSLAGITNGGLFYIHLLDTFAAGTSLLLVVLFESLAIGWLYGMEQFCEDAKAMLGYTPGMYWRICWKFISPLFLLAIVICSIVTYSPLMTELSHRVIIYPEWANVLGWLIVVLIFTWVPAFAIYTFCFKYSKPKCLRTRVALCITPVAEHRQILDGHNPRRFQLFHWLHLGGDCSLLLAPFVKTKSYTVETQMDMLPGSASDSHSICNSLSST